MFYGTVIMVIGMGLILSGWYSLYRQSGSEGFARSGLYAYSRHPQYVGFVMLIMGWFVGWPTLITVVFSPILIYKYIKAARKEEEYMIAQFGQAYIKYKGNTPFLI
jgi:protein-S-isoprenylcysteine O-methyltransferase Ste14